MSQLKILDRFIQHIEKNKSSYNEEEWSLLCSSIYREKETFINENMDTLLKENDTPNKPKGKPSRPKGRPPKGKTWDTETGEWTTYQVLAQLETKKISELMKLAKT